MEEVVKIGKRGQITIPTEMRKKESFEEGDFISVSDIEGILILKKLEKKPNALDIFETVGDALLKKGIATKADVLKFTDEIKKEVMNESSSRH